MEKRIHHTSLLPAAAASSIIMNIALVTRESRKQGDLQKGKGEKMVWGPGRHRTKRTYGKESEGAQWEAKSNWKTARPREQKFGAVRWPLWNFTLAPGDGTHSSSHSPPVFTFLKEIVGCSNFRDADLEPRLVHSLPSTGACYSRRKSQVYDKQ